MFSFCLLIQTLRLKTYSAKAREVLEADRRADNEVNVSLVRNEEISRRMSICLKENSAPRNVIDSKAGYGGSDAKKLTSNATLFLSCAMCNYTTNRSNNLSRHIQTMHTELLEKPECCGRTFATRFENMEHNRVCHASSKFPCSFPECVRKRLTFDRRGLLHRHISGVHLGEKPFKCMVCCYQSTHKGNLDRHVRARHPETINPRTVVDASVCTITLEMDQTDVIKLKLDDERFAVDRKEISNNKSLGAKSVLPSVTVKEEPAYADDEPFDLDMEVTDIKHEPVEYC